MFGDPSHSAHNETSRFAVETIPEDYAQSVSATVTSATAVAVGDDSIEQYVSFVQAVQNAAAGVDGYDSTLTIKDVQSD